MTQYAIFNPEKGYMYEDEDMLPGSSTYDHEIDDFTIFFAHAEDALRNADQGDIIAILENKVLVGVYETKRMTKEGVNRVYGKSFV